MMNDRNLPSVTALIVTGILLVTLGVIAIATPAVAGKAVVIAIGAMMVLAGLGQIITGYRAEGWGRRLPPLILGVLTLICGGALLAEPWIGMEFIALIIAIFFLVQGIWQMIASFSYRPASGWFALLISGVLTLVLGIMIYLQWPLSGLWAVGVLVGVNLLMTGASMLAVGITVRQLRNANVGVSTMESKADQ